MTRRKRNDEFSATCEAPGCYTTFLTRISTRKYCSDKCAKKAENIRRAERIKASKK